MSTINSLNTAALTGRFDPASKHPGAFSRLAGWFRRAPAASPAAGEAAEGAEAPEVDASRAARETEAGDVAVADEGSRSSQDPTHAPEALVPSSVPSGGGPRGSLFRKWSRRDQAAAGMETIQSGLGALVELMEGIQDGLAKQSARQDEVLRYLAHVPAALEQLPEGIRAQAEALRALHLQAAAMQQQAGVMQEQADAARQQTQEQLQRQIVTIQQQGGAMQQQALQQSEWQITQQGQVDGLLERMSRADAVHGRYLKAVDTRIEALGRNDQAIWSQVKTVNRSAEATTQVLTQLRDHLAQRDDEIKKVVERQGARFTTFLVAATGLSVAALGAAVAFGYMILTKVH